MPAHGDIRPALPFLVLYTAAFLFSGLSVARVTFLLYAFLYPGATEESLYRGGVQPLLLRSGASPAPAIALATLVFAGGHIPDFVFRVYPGMLLLAMGQVASVALYGTLLGYGGA
ncbi:MAG TPA: CPBP family intramembrane metalloprotease [Firmicutes bacterium]|nr:CPBP family intramembrane metalloprotease [Bacillota bacterium]HHY98482.1 CPBP family intramembrane metalloprotease [Bacillota bacterium]